MKGTYELLYWPVSALGEPIRLCMVLGGLEFKDTTPKTSTTFMEEKLTGPYGESGQVGRARVARRGERNSSRSPSEGATAGS